MQYIVLDTTANKVVVLYDKPRKKEKGIYALPVNDHFAQECRLRDDVLRGAAQLIRAARAVGCVHEKKMGDT